jgi:hypothetical protein
MVPYIINGTFGSTKNPSELFDPLLIFQINFGFIEEKFPRI